MAEIKAILEREDVAGIVIIHTPQFSEFLFRIDPSYSCAAIEGDKLRIKALKKYFPNLQAWKNKIADTTNMLIHFADVGGPLILNVHEALDRIEKVVEIENKGGGGFTSHTTQNN